MSHRKFERPRHGNLGFLPRKMAQRNRGRIRSWPKDNPSHDPHLTAFLAYKAGMTHIVRELDVPGSKMHKKEVVEAVSVIEAPPMIAVGLVGYVKTIKGYATIHTVWAQHLPEQFRRTSVRDWGRSSKKAFTNYTKNMFDGAGKKTYDKQILAIKRYAAFVRVIAISQPKTIKGMRQKRSHVLEIQVNGGCVADKVNFALSLFEKEIPVSSVFEDSEVVDALAITTGHGFEGVVHRWGVTRLPRKTHKGLRKVACIGAWHPARVGYTVPRAGQHGYHHRVNPHLKIYKIGTSALKDKANARCDADLTDKTITPMGGFRGFGIVQNDYLLLKGSVPGPKKRVLTLRKTLRLLTNRASTEKIHLKFIDTSSVRGHGKFQTTEEKLKFMGPTKRVALAKKAEEAKTKKSSGKGKKDKKGGAKDTKSSQKKGTKK
eukprot:NODE_782_length_1454_cov_493.049822_g646_i0.p1 GENE.NODE_782_length_1454_cov_493.049822_g646_i0~~NODE_782_length_1454_cov_493.049822_g646_i0.p1  ORF type:complete len:431 (-),score=110.34 NODE_782_length_1454_cov_493.049822_g646_i0:101-1393(-)